MPPAGTSASLLIVAVILALLLAADSFFIICAAQGVRETVGAIHGSVITHGQTADRCLIW